MNALIQDDILFSIRALRVSFGGGRRAFEVVRSINLDAKHGEVLGIVGESGSGKSIGLLASIGLQPEGATVHGSVKFKGRELVGLPRREMRKLRGSRIAMIFQDPLSSLNPVMKIGAQLTEALQLHQPDLGNNAAEKRAIELLDLVSISEPERRVKQYPHEFSGGMRQRVMIAMALANDPDLLIADEPTTALDVTVQAQVMDVLQRLQKQLNLGLVLITHDLGVLAGRANRVAVMYAGEVVEHASVDELFSHPRHPYTRGLIASIPNMSVDRDRLYSIEGTSPSPAEMPPGCAFHPRCPMAAEICTTTPPPFRQFGDHRAACHFAELVEKAPI